MQFISQITMNYADITKNLNTIHYFITFLYDEKKKKKETNAANSYGFFFCCQY